MQSGRIIPAGRSGGHVPCPQRPGSGDRGRGRGSEGRATEAAAEAVAAETVVAETGHEVRGRISGGVYPGSRTARAQAGPNGRQSIPADRSG